MVLRFDQVGAVADTTECLENLNSAASSMRRPVSVKPPFSKSRWSCQVYGADQREAAVTCKLHHVFSFPERFLFFYCRIARLVAEQIETVQLVGILVLPGCHRRLALVFASRPASIRTRIELLSSVPDGVPRFGWGAAISATVSTRPRRRTQSAPYRRLCSTSCQVVAPVLTSTQSNSVSFPISISVDRLRRRGHLAVAERLIHLARNP